MKNTRDEFISHSPVKLVDEVILRAYADRASDIHIEPGETECRVRIRVDGNLLVIGRYKKEIHEEAMARLKVLSALRTDVRNSPQDGRFKVQITGVPLNIRISVVPTFYGEKSVLRLLPHTAQSKSFADLGFNEDHCSKINKIISEPHGMILVVGPTGSGKTTTLYSLLGKISSPHISVVTLEDPVEYALAEATQIPLHSASHMTFASALRSVLRQDPDVIMVGEIRDNATAELSVHAALTGHLLLSTLHTNDAVTAIPRLVDMDIEPFLIASTLKGIVSQRLVRKICTKCKTEKKPAVSEIEYLNKNKEKLNTAEYKIWYGRGCAECRSTGYTGRTVVSEVIFLTDKLRDLIVQKASSDELRRCAIEEGMLDVKEDAIQKVFAGLTTLDEVAISFG